jgi:general secretion pathway protein D
MDEPARVMKKACLILLLCIFLTKPSSSWAENKVIFNFVDVDLPVIAKFVSDVTDKNFIFDETFKGQVTIIAPTKMNAHDAFKLFTSVLELKGFTLIPSGVNAYKIVRTSAAKQEGLAVKESGTPVNESYIVRLQQLKYISADDAVNLLRPVISRDGHVSSFGPGNLALIIDSGLNIEKVLAILDIIDKPSTADTPDIIFLKYAGAEDVAKMVNEGNQPVPGQPARPGGNVSGRVVADTRLNAVLIFGPKDVREPLKALISILDVPAEESQGKINIYSLVNASAEDVAKVLQGVIKGIEEAKTPQASIPGGPRREQGIIVTPDKSTNSLVIISSPAEYRNIYSIIQKLDRRKKQVYVEAMIVEATISNLLDLGSRWRIIANKNGEPVVIGGVGVIDQTAVQSIIQGLAGFSIGGMGNFLNIPVNTVGADGTITTQNLNVPGYAALFSLNEFKDAVNVLSTPQILTSDNEEAEILVGENVPFVTQRQTGTATAATAGILTDVVRQDVGIKLRITPQIAEGDYVRLDLYQEISAVQNTSDAVFISVGPTTTKRSTKTSVVVKDNQTVVIGGLMQEKSEDTINKIPLLGDIPILGWLFKSKTKTKDKTNLFVFLTPHIIRDANDLNSLTRMKGTEFARSQNLYISGQLLMRFKGGVDKDTIEKILKENNATIINYLEDLDIYIIGLPQDADIEEAIAKFSTLKEVQFAEPNYQFKYDQSYHFNGQKAEKQDKEGTVGQ